MTVWRAISNCTPNMITICHLKQRADDVLFSKLLSLLLLSHLHGMTQGGSIERSIERSIDFSTLNRIFYVMMKLDLLWSELLLTLT